MYDLLTLYEHRATGDLALSWQPSQSRMMGWRVEPSCTAGFTEVAAGIMRGDAPEPGVRIDAGDLTSLVLDANEPSGDWQIVAYADLFDGGMSCHYCRVECGSGAEAMIGAGVASLMRGGEEANEENHQDS